MSGRSKRSAFSAKKMQGKKLTQPTAPERCHFHAGFSPLLFLMLEKLQQPSSRVFTRQLRTVQIHNCCETSWIITRRRRMSVEKLQNASSKPASLNPRKARVRKTASSPKSDQSSPGAYSTFLPR